jgi:hypothetical protein
VLAALVPAYAIAVSMPAGPDDGCPSPRQVVDALATQLPGLVLPLGRAGGRQTLHLAVTVDGVGVMRLELTDPDGGPLLHRRLPATERGAGADCPALAETAALIVERYWREVGYEVPFEPPSPPRPPPPADAAAPPGEPSAAVVEGPAPASSPPVPLLPPRWWIAGGAFGRVGDAGPRTAGASLTFTVEERLQQRRVGLSLSGGAEGGVTYLWTSGSPERVVLRQFPVRMGAYLAVPLGLGQLEPGLGIDLGVVTAAVTDVTGSQTRWRASPGVDAALGWSLRFVQDIYLRVLGEGGAAVPYRFVTTSNETSFGSTSRLYLQLGLELGLWFP